MSMPVVVGGMCVRCELGGGVMGMFVLGVCVNHGLNPFNFLVNIGIDTRTSFAGTVAPRHQTTNGELTVIHTDQWSTMSTDAMLTLIHPTIVI